MMLVISVIVAVAILGILLSFLGNINTFGADAKTVVPDLVKKVANKGYGIENKDNVEFAVGYILKGEAIGEAPIADASVSFVCDMDSATCGGTSGTKPLEVTADKITVNKKISGSIAVCGNEGKYSITVGDKGAKGLASTSAKCLNAVGIS